MSPPAVDPDRATVVAFYGPKAEPLSGLLRTVQEQLGLVMGRCFEPRPRDDMHATIIGLGRPAAVGSTRDVPGLLAYLGEAFLREPLSIQFGGFEDDDRRLLSRRHTLAERTLTLQGHQVVLMGWPVVGAEGCAEPAPLLGEIRRRCADYGVRHKHDVVGDQGDPDAYLVIGELRDMSRDEATDVVRRVRATSALRRPTFVTLGRNDLSLVEYVDRALPRATSRWWPV